MWDEGHPESLVARRFIEAINARDPDAIAALMAEDHEFVDATGVAHSGRESMRLGWVQYLKAFPDYRLEVVGSVGAGEMVAIFGWAAATYQGIAGPGRSWRIPGAWKAVVRSGRVVHWSVYCDVEPILQSMGQGRF